MYRRADLSRTMMLVVALLLMALSTSAFAREFRAADAQSEDRPTVQALHYVGSRFEASMAGLSGSAGRDPAIAQLIERIRKVE